MTVMVIANLTIILYISCKVGRDQFIYIATAATQPLNPATSAKITQ